MSILRSILAVFAGLVVVAVGSLATDGILQAMGVFPPLGDTAFPARLLLIATAHRAVWGVAGGYVAARLAPFTPALHAIVLGAIGLVLNIYAAIAMWSAGAHWYPLLLAIISIPTAWLGARLTGRR